MSNDLKYINSACFIGFIALDTERSSVCSCGKSSIDQRLRRVLKWYGDIKKLLLNEKSAFSTTTNQQ